MAASLRVATFYDLTGNLADRQLVVTALNASARRIGAHTDIAHKLYPCWTFRWGPEKAFGEALWEIRKERGISQERLALDCDLDRTYISLIERGVRRRPPRQAEKPESHHL